MKCQWIVCKYWNNNVILKLLYRDCEYMKIIHLNCGLRNEYESDLRSNEHYFGGSENKVWKTSFPPFLPPSLPPSLFPDDEDFYNLLGTKHQHNTEELFEDLFWFDSRGSANHYEADDGYQEAAQSLQASAPEAEANYAQVDMTKKKKNRRPPADEYAQVDKSKKTKKRPKVTMTSRKVLCHYCCTFGGTYFYFFFFGHSAVRCLNLFQRRKGFSS